MKECAQTPGDLTKCVLDYHFHAERVTYDKAQEQCKDLHAGVLVTIVSLAHQEYLMESVFTVS